MSGLPDTRAVSISTAGYEDGLGRRSVRFDREVGGMLECLHLRPELWAFESSLRERADAIELIEDERFVRVRAIERGPHGLAVVSELIGGQRLSDIIETRQRDDSAAFGIDAALGFLLQVLPALSTLHSLTFAHGALAPGRILVTAASQIVLLDGIYGAALERLNLSRSAMWANLGILASPFAGAPRFDSKADVIQAAFCALLLAVGRPLESDGDPAALGPLVIEVRELAEIRAGRVFASRVQEFFAAALPLNRRIPALSADDGAFEVQELAEMIGEEGCHMAFAHLARFEAGASKAVAPDEDFEDHRPPKKKVAAAAAKAPSRPEPDPAPARVKPGAETSSPAPVAREAVTPAPTIAKPEGTAPAPMPAVAPGSAPVAAPAVTASVAAAALDHAADAERAHLSGESSVSPERAHETGESRENPERAHETRESRESPERAHETRESRESPERAHETRESREPLAIPIPAVTAASPPALPILPTPPPSPVPTVATAPVPVPMPQFAPVQPFQVASPMPAPPVLPPRIVQPAAVAPPPVQPVPVPPPPQPITIAAPIPVRVRTEPPKGYTPARQEVEAPIRAVPVDRARIEGGRRFPWKFGAAAVIVLAVGILAGRPYLLGGDAELAVVPETTKPAAPVTATLPTAGKTGSLAIDTQPTGARVSIDGTDVGVTPLKLEEIAPGRHAVVVTTGSATVRRTVRVEAGRQLTLDIPVYSGWVVVFSPIPLDIASGSTTLGNTDTGKIILPPGRHVLTLTNREFGFSDTRTVEIHPGEERPLNIEPKGLVNVNAHPWAEVWIDGKKAGDTPIANLPVLLGTRVFVFKHPQYGERRVTTTITSKPTALTIDLTKP